MDADHPIKAPQADRLGFGPMASHLAQAILSNDLRGGFVIGVEGAWGSGKSSLVNLALSEIENATRKPVVVRFLPWLVGQRDELLGQLFAQLGEAVEAAGGQAGVTLHKTMARFSAASGSISGAVRLAGKLGLPLAEVIADGVDAAGQATGKAPSLAELKEQIRAGLQALDRPIVIFMDDLDRLEPGEAVEVLRLVRAVADFPNVAYLLAYDKAALAGNIERALGVADGGAYLEKIVQAAFSVPRAQEFDLLNWLVEQTLALLPCPPEGAAAARVRDVAQVWGRRYLETPRDVIRVLNGLRLNAVPVAQRIDPGDALFLQILATKRPGLYDWVERYVTQLAALSDGRVILQNVMEEMGERLLPLLAEFGRERDHMVFELSEILPGIDRQSLIRDGEEFRVLTDYLTPLRETAQRERRLASPVHHRLYFAFSEPAGSVSDDALRGFVDQAMADPEAAAEAFRVLIARDRPQGGVMADVMLQRLRDGRDNCLSDQAAAILNVMGEVLEDLARHHEIRGNFPGFLRGDDSEIIGVLSRIEISKCHWFLCELITNAGSLSWIARLVRGINLRTQWAGIDDEAVKSLNQNYAKRLSHTSDEDILQAAVPSTILFAWLDLDEPSARAFVKRMAGNDATLLRLLEGLASQIVSSDRGAYQALRAKTLEGVFGAYNGISERVERLATPVDSPLQSKARRILEMITDDLDL